MPDVDEQDGVARGAVSGSAAGGGPAGSVAGQRVPVEWWQRWLERRAAWRSAHPLAVVRIAHARVVGMWLALVYLLVMVVVSPSYLSSLRVALACLVLLVWWHALARTKTLSWRGLSLLFTASIWWAPVVAWLTTVMANHVAVGRAGTQPGVSMAGAQTALAAFAEESLKLVPLLVWAVAAPGRVRRLSCVDWLLAGFASGLGFQLVEDVMRRLVRSEHRGGLFSFLVDDGPWSGLPQYGWGPLGGISRYGVPAHAAFYGGHHVATALVAAAVGLAVAWWRRVGRAPRPAGRRCRPRCPAGQARCC